MLLLATLKFLARAVQSQQSLFDGRRGTAADEPLVLGHARLVVAFGARCACACSAVLIRDMGNNVVPLRRPSGTPVGGQFAPTTRDEAEVVLESPVRSAFDLPDGSVWSHWTDDGEADAIVTDREGVGSGIVRALDADQWHTSDGRTAYSWSASADGRQIGSGIVTDPEEAMMFVSSALDRAERGIKDEWEVDGHGRSAASWASREDLTLFVNHFRHDDVGWAVSRDGIEIACGDSTDSVSAQLAATQVADQVRDGSVSAERRIPGAGADDAGGVSAQRRRAVHDRRRVRSPPTSGASRARSLRPSATTSRRRWRQGNCHPR